jgi:hypothetical protein
MGNISSCIERYNYEKSLKRKCTYCNLTLDSVKEKKKHIQTCIYNKEIAPAENSIYSDDPFRL